MPTNIFSKSNSQPDPDDPESQQIVAPNPQDQLAKFFQQKMLQNQQQGGQSNGQAQPQVPVTQTPDQKAQSDANYAQVIKNMAGQQAPQPLDPQTLAKQQALQQMAQQQYAAQMSPEAQQALQDKQAQDVRNKANQDDLENRLKGNQ